jgi:sugar O-acyltransferase (sialic acid O-acetyltransferase NeuD family)
MSRSLPMRTIVYGARTRYAAEVAEIFARLAYEAVVYADNLPGGPEPPPVGPIVLADDLDPTDGEVGVIVPIFAPALRKRVVAEAAARGYRIFPVLTDPTSVIARSATLGRGTIVNALVVVASNTAIGQFVNVNRSTSIGHDNTIGDYVSFGPGCVVMGNVTLGTGAFVGGASTLLPDITVGANAVIGAGSVVTHDVPANTLVIGSPARAVRETSGYGEQGV